MIIVKNRELLIPNNERYIGTTYDNDTENRVFQVPRFSQRGVDLANLTFRLDIQYANESYDTVVLDKEVGEAFIILIWRITSATLQVPGTMYIGLRAIDDEATVKWSSFSAAMYAERHLNTPGNYGGSLTEIEQIEQDHQYMKGVVDELKENIDYAHDAEAWAKGTRSGSAVPSTDPTYHNNSKYYSDQANTKATQAANSATAAANSATQAAETVSDTNTRFNNAMAAVTSETEVIDARVGADGTQYPVLKTRLDTEHTQLKSALEDAESAVAQTVATKAKDRQIFDIATMLPQTPYMLTVNSSLKYVTSSGWRLYPIEINGETGDTFSFNIVTNSSGEVVGFKDCNFWAGNDLPEEDKYVLQVGVGSTANRRGTITLSEPCKYLLIGIKSSMTSWPYDPYTEACNAIMGHIVVRRGGYTDTNYYPYEIEYVYKVVPYYQGSDNNGKILKVGNDGYIYLADEPGSGGEVPDDAVGYYANQIVNVDSSILTSDITLGTGWSGNLSDGFTHTTGNTAELVFNATTENGEGYIIDFDVTGNTGDNLYATIGSEPYVDVYNGTSHVRIGIIADGGKLKIKPVSGYSGTITNIKLRKVIETGGTEITQAVSNIKDVGAEDNLTGFWNVAIGGMKTLQHNQNGSRNIAIGFMAVRDLKSGTRNICIGTFAMPFVTEGERNVCIGADTLYDTGTPGDRKALDNVAIGKAAMKSGSDVEKNVAIGTNAMGNSSGTATGNVGVGYGALYKCANNNVAVGMNANYFGTGGNNVAIGYGSGAKNTAPSSSNSIAIGYDTQFSKSNQMVLGNTSITEVVMCGNKKINFNNDGTVTWETIS